MNKLICNNCSVELEEVDIKEECINFKNNKIYLRGYFVCPQCEENYHIQMIGSCKIGSIFKKKC